MQVKPGHLEDPLWVYADITSELVYLEDAAVWAIRDQVRAIETDRKPVAKPKPDYRRLHDLARHAIHVTETLDVTMHTMEGMLLQHQELRSDVVDEQAWRAVHQRLLFSKQMVGSLQYRSRSNQERLQNEIQLSFNIVAQYDSGVSVKIAQAAKADSAAMKTISLLTLAFLPPTFICAIFSMSFFDYSADSGWIVSGRIWIYFVFAIPLTLAASVVCYLWQGIFPAEPLDQPDIHPVASA
jgi:Mg2+ and Co2+ transporter CorA